MMKKWVMIGQSVLEISDLSIEKREEENLYNKFTRRRIR